jgi:lipoprotein-anchoring transpeptidase ErfK/SrfK
MSVQETIVLKKSVLPSIRPMAACFRMAVMAALVALLPAACASTAQQSAYGAPPATPMYAAMPYERFPIPAVDTGRVASKYLRQIVDYRTPERPGTIIVDTPNKFLYLVLENGKAMRYGIGVGREGYSWAGKARVGAKRAWPTWTPPAEMIAREPRLEPFRDGQPPGIDNPLGARALYIFEGNRDTLYRLHGTSEQWSIGKAVSSGCIRLFNQDIIDLYGRVPVGAPIVVIPDPSTIIG